MRLAAATLAVALCSLAVPQKVLAQDEQIAPDGGVAEEEGSPVVNPPEKEGQSTGSGSSASTAPSAPPAAGGTAQTKAASAAPSGNDWDFEFEPGHIPSNRPVHTKRSKRAVLSFIPFLAAGVVSAGAVAASIALAHAELCVQSCDDDDSPEEQEAEEDEDARVFAKKTTLYTVPITWLIAAPFHALMLNSAYRRHGQDTAVGSGAFIGAFLGLVVDVGLAFTLYFTTEHWASMAVPSIIGLVALPTIGGATGAHIVRRSWRTARVAIGPPIPVALAAANGVVPGFALSGAF